MVGLFWMFGCQAPFLRLLSQIDCNDNKQYHPGLLSIFNTDNKTLLKYTTDISQKVPLENSFKKGNKVSARFIYI